MSLQHDIHLEAAALLKRIENGEIAALAFCTIDSDNNIYTWASLESEKDDVLALAMAIARLNARMVVESVEIAGATWAKDED